jgi:hypothetical protein
MAFDSLQASQVLSGTTSTTIHRPEAKIVPTQDNLRFGAEPELPKKVVVVSETVVYGSQGNMSLPE